MSDEEIDQLIGIVKTVVRIAVTAHVEAAVMARVLLAHGIVPSQEFESARAKRLSEIEPLIQSIGSASTQSLLELLKKFEGPVQ